MTFLRPKRLEKKASDAREPSLYRSICTSIFSTLLSLVMLVGTTFAWFTDSITSNVFTITAGNVNTRTSYYVGDAVPNDGTTWTLLSNTSEEGNSIFGGVTFTSGKVQTAYLMLENLGQNTVKYKISLFKVVGEQAGVLVSNSGIAEETGIATQTNEAPVVETKYLSEMMSFGYAVTEDVDTFMVAAQSGEDTSESNGVQVSESAAKPFQIEVAGQGTKYVKLTLKLADYVGEWQSLPSISLKLKIVITQPGDNEPVTLEDEETSQQANGNEAENVTEPAENEKQPIVTVGVDMTTEIETPAPSVVQPQQPAAGETGSGGSDTAGNDESTGGVNATENSDSVDTADDTAGDTDSANVTEDGGNAGASDDAAGAAADGAADSGVSENSETGDVPAADPAV